jgi:hypothetical protein
MWYPPYPPFLLFHSDCKEQVGVGSHQRKKEALGLFFLLTLLE